MLPLSIDVHDLLPHRHPFLFVDEITSIEIGRSARGLYRVSSSHPFINSQGEVSTFPSLLIIEALAQIAAICIGMEHFIKGRVAHSRGYLVRIDQCSLDSPVHAEEPLSLTANLVARFGSLYKFNTIGQVSQRVVATATLTLYLES